MSVKAANQSFSFRAVFNLLLLIYVVGQNCPTFASETGGCAGAGAEGAGSSRSLASQLPGSFDFFPPVGMTLVHLTRESLPDSSHIDTYESSRVVEILAKFNRPQVRRYIEASFREDGTSRTSQPQREVFRVQDSLGVYQWEGSKWEPYVLFRDLHQVSDGGDAAIHYLNGALHVPGFRVIL